MIASFPTPPHKEERSEQEIRLVIRDEANQLMEKKSKKLHRCIGTIIAVTTLLLTAVGILLR